MPYNDDTVWKDWVSLLEQKGRALANAASDGERNGYDEWQSFRNGRTNAQIGTALGQDETKIADMDSAYATFPATRKYIENDTPPTGSDYAFALRKFT